MRYSTLIMALCFCAGLFLLSGFQSESKDTPIDSREAMIAAEVERRVDDFIERRKKRCEEKVLKKAVEVVDSILIERARLMTIDTFQKPPIPLRPEKPEVPINEDTSAIVPILPPRIDSILTDSLVEIPDTISNE